MLLNWLISFIMAFSGQAVITFAAVKMLEIRRAWVVWVVAVASCAVTAWTNSQTVPGDFQALWSAVNLVVSISVYVGFSQLKPLRALFVVACIMLVTLLAEFATALFALYCLDVNLASGPTFAYRYPGAFVLLITIHALMLGLLLYIASVLMRGIGMGMRGKGTGRMLIFPVSQAALLLASMLAIRALAVQDERALGFGAILIVLVLCAYLLFYVAAKKIFAQEVLDMRVAAAQEHAAAVHEQARGLAQESQRVAKLRHDFRNQVQTIELLCTQGELGRARAMLDELTEKVERELAQ